jgi:SAM-dependent methyltransferase
LIDLLVRLDANKTQVNILRRQAEAFARYRRYLPREGRILDWGCMHGRDSCMIRHDLGERVALDGCDFGFEERWRPNHEYASLRYTGLEHPYRLPYEDASFDAVVGSGTFEHTVLPFESLKELYRVMKDDAVLVMTFLPNRSSLAELVARIQDRPRHLRLYGKPVDPAAPRVRAAVHRPSPTGAVAAPARPLLSAMVDELVA